MPKTGRPKAETPKVKTLTMRVTEEEYTAISKYAKTHDLTITKVLQKGVEELLKQS